MTNYGNGNYSITARSGREYLVVYSGYGLNSSLFTPDNWSKPYKSLGISYYPRAGYSLGGGSIRWVDMKARLIIRRIEFRLAVAAFRDRRNQRFLQSLTPKEGTTHE